MPKINIAPRDTRIVVYETAANAQALQQLAEQESQTVSELTRGIIRDYLRVALRN